MPPAVIGYDDKLASYSMARWPVYSQRALKQANKALSKQSEISKNLDKLVSATVTKSVPACPLS